MSTIYSQAPKLARKNFPVPTCNSHRSSDGRYVQLLGVDLARHLSKTLNAFGVAKPTYAKMLWAVLSKVIWIKGPKFIKALPMLAVINEALEHEIAKYTYKQLIEIFEKHDVW